MRSKWKLLVIHQNGKITHLAIGKDIYIYLAICQPRYDFRKLPICKGLRRFWGDWWFLSETENLSDHFGAINKMMSDIYFKNENAIQKIEKERKSFWYFLRFIIFVKPKETQTRQSSPPFGCLVSKGVSKEKLKSKILDIQEFSGYGS